MVTAEFCPGEGSVDLQTPNEHTMEDEANASPYHHHREGIMNAQKHMSFLEEFLINKSTNLEGVLPWQLKVYMPVANQGMGRGEGRPWKYTLNRLH